MLDEKNYDKIISNIRAKRSLMNKKISNGIRINIGCGMSPTIGWSNFDNSLSLRLSRNPLITSILYRLKLISSEQLDYIKFCQKNNIRFANATKNIPLQDKSVEVLYSSHMLEHLDKNEAGLFLKEAIRVLQNGGIIRLCLPDLAKCIEEYNKTKNADVFIESTYLCSEKPKTFVQRLHMAFIGNRHHLYMYDGKSLSKLLKDSGFTNVQVLECGKTNIEQHFPLNLKERQDESVYVEAYKELS